MMKINVPLEKGYLADQYAKYAPATQKIDGYPSQSFPIEITNLPVDTRFLAWTLVDFDSIPVMGFTYIHWIAANYPVLGSEALIPANLAQEGENFTRGQNSLYSQYVDVDNPQIINNYIGPMPPDKDHNYTLTVYALKQALPLPDGFFLNELRQATHNQPVVLEKMSIDILARS
ncbi:YbhB/YbcL family Raf kinase inhibitor-like protein [Convivina intestini]|uniref:PBP family phospholipid-binding protein n=1 Tax=Convivina intestini TaxID=1505726 RepID=A0A2U1D9G5_9LACO|nr:YbhB/YbcL family Raf kinase inhibitor-like protein [Convivina intestini]PVY84326.1 hypothetical protein C7384_10471 [Convivina intestini]CAH1855546.1 hypothetical protein R077811_01088 [Convivina intestini]SDB94374.1 hypothetical protein SAMN05216341_10670 [Leuconostocaceae bacterium R-53105]